MTQRVDTLLIFGASGDLTARLLLPGLGQLLSDQPNRRLELIGVGSADWSDDEWRTLVTSSFGEASADGACVDALLAQTRYVKADVTDAADLTKVLGMAKGTPAIYFALPPAVAAQVVVTLQKVDFPAGLTLALEKPFGMDVPTAEALNGELAKLVPENQIHRVDHFLGRSTVFNILGLRFANRIFEPVWNSEHIAEIAVVYDEQLGLEGRAGYYDKAGALIDMIQSHLLQVMAVLAMEPPSTLGQDDLRDSKELVLRATRLWGDDPKASSRRARYTAGSIDGREMPSYAAENGVDPARETETLAEVTLEVSTWRWKGVPITLRSGKAIGQRRREIVVTFKPAQQLPVGLTGANSPTVLRIFLAPDAMSLELDINGPGDPYELERVSLDATFGDGQLLAYREVLAGILDGDPTLSVRGDSAVEGWRILAPVIAAWRADEVPLEEYAAGTEGPDDWKPVG